MSEVKENVNLLKGMNVEELQAEVQKQIHHPKRVDVIASEIARRKQK